jgi:hypothetical protein
MQSSSLMTATTGAVCSGVRRSIEVRISRSELRNAVSGKPGRNVGQPKRVTSVVFESAMIPPRVRITS